MYQNIKLIGHLGKDPEQRYTPTGQAVTNFSMATTHAYTNKAEEKVKETTWWRVSVWGAQAEACKKYLNKGSLVMVEGRMSVDKSTGAPKIFTKQDGTASTSLEVIASRVLFLSSSKSGTDEHAPVAGEHPSGVEDDIPF